MTPLAPAASSSPEDPGAASSSNATSRPSIKKQAWTQEEDEKLLAIVTEQGPSCWSQIAVSLPGRLGKQCRERWHNHLAPEVKKDNFSEEEDRIIIEAVAKHGTKWSLIVKLVPGRTDNAIKNRWNSAARRLNRMQRRQDADEMACVGLDPTVGDVTSLDSQVLARHLLKTGLDPRVPRAKRKLAVDSNAAAGKRAAPCKETPSMNGLEMLCELTTTASTTATEAQTTDTGAPPSGEDKKLAAAAHQDVAAMLLSLGQV